ncbi:SRPBCC domain-containing protein [Streptomyces sp. N2-109]|uniref:SRPBCC domain-containing protein n=1 Tax=Streptomyces gossypii TaxID=2883101 RepID=A0ABT2JUS5_9ACTN|nr:SRPBCC domain-containing protein [Streptomyces gossypii]MCT2591637.1 SRPBCC domain-containing protein [Streptomyces gossypii]
MPVPDRIERVLELHHPPEKVWAALTTADGLGGWFGSSAEIDDLRPGGQARVRWNDGEEHTLWIQIVDPPRRFSYRWAIEGLPPSDPRRTYVEFTLEPRPAGTRLTVVETGFAQLPDDQADAYEGNATGWRTELAELTEYLDAAA